MHYDGTEDSASVHVKVAWAGRSRERKGDGRWAIESGARWVEVVLAYVVCRSCRYCLIPESIHHGTIHKAASYNPLQQSIRPTDIDTTRTTRYNTANRYSHITNQT